MDHTQSHGASDRLIRSEILHRFELLTKADIDYCGTDFNKLVKMICTRYGYAERRAEKEVELFFGEFQSRLRMAA